MIYLNIFTVALYMVTKIIYIINELYCIIRNKKDKSEKIKRLKRQITFFVKPYLAK